VAKTNLLMPRERVFSDATFIYGLMLAHPNREFAIATDRCPDRGVLYRPNTCTVSTGIEARGYFSQPTICQGHSDSVQQTADIYIEEGRRWPEGPDEGSPANK
jgi:hypothetical protein